VSELRTAVLTAALLVGGHALYRGWPRLQTYWRVSVGLAELVSDLEHAGQLLSFLDIDIGKCSDEQVGSFACEAHGKLRPTVAKHQSCKGSWCRRDGPEPPSGDLAF
jgi:hypothetical protein